VQRPLPSGTVTFLFTDVEGSTKLLHALGAEGYAAALTEKAITLALEELDALASRSGLRPRAIPDAADSAHGRDDRPHHGQ
jgi:class 3 adenylate cyclase